MIGAFLRRVMRVLRAQNSWNANRDYVSVHPGALVDESANLNLLRRPSEARILLSIGDGSHVFSIFSILRPEASIRVGARCQLGRSQIVSAISVEIGDDVIMSWGVTVLDSDNHSPYWSERDGDVERSRRGYLETGGVDIARHHDWSVVGMAPVRIGDISISVDLSVGIAFSTGQDDADSLLARADHALYQAKRNGRARIEVVSSAP